MASTAPQQNPCNWQVLFDLLEQSHRGESLHLHIEPDASFWRVRFHRLDGLHEELISNSLALSEAVNALQSSLWGAHFNKMAKRDCHFKLQLNNASTLCRLVVVPARNGDTLQFTLRPDEPIPPTLDTIGFSSSQLRAIRQSLNAKQGWIVIAGPEHLYTERTFQAIALQLSSPDKKILSLAVNHYHELPRVTQVTLAGLSQMQQSALCDSALELNNDVILIDDSISTGTLTTLRNCTNQHRLIIQIMRAPNSQSVIRNLLANNHTSQWLAQHLRTIVMHYPARTLCPHCKSLASVTDDQLKTQACVRMVSSQGMLSWLDDGHRYLQPGACDDCAQTGYKGSVSIFDIVEVDARLREALEQNNTHAQVQLLGNRHVVQDTVMRYAKQGDLSIDDANRLVHSLT